MVNAGAIDILLKQVRMLNRGIPDQEVIKHVLSTLRNIVRHPLLLQVFIDTPHSGEIIFQEVLRFGHLKTISSEYLCPFLVFFYSKTYYPSLCLLCGHKIFHWWLASLLFCAHECIIILHVNQYNELTSDLGISFYCCPCILILLLIPLGVLLQEQKWRIFCCLWSS